MKSCLLILCTSVLLCSDFTPENNRDLNYTQVFFRWPQIANSENYQFILATDSTFSNSETIITSSNSILYNQILNWDEDYYWMVCKDDEFGDTCLDMMQFSINPLPSYHTENIEVQYIDEENYFDGINIIDEKGNMNLKCQIFKDCKLNKDCK